MVATATRLHVIYQLGGPTEVRVFDFEGKPARAPKQLPVSTVGGLSPMGGDDFLYTNVSYLEPLGQYLFKAGTNETEKTLLTSPAPVTFSDVKVVPRGRGSARWLG